MRRLALAAALVLVPSLGWACPGCVASPYGDRTFGWAYLVLYIAPFLIAAGIVAALVYYSRSSRPATARAWRSIRSRRRRSRRTAEASGRGTSALLEAHGLDKETT
jgi:hypothetical protein